MGITLRNTQRQLEKWLRAAAGHSAPVIILGGAANTLSFARSLGRRGIPILILDTEQYLGIFTRHAQFIELPPVQTCPDDWINNLVFISSRQTAPAVLFTTSDTHTRFVAKHQETFKCHFRFLVAEAETIECILNKRLQYSFARSIGVPIPLTYFPQSVEEARQFATEVRYPCLLKPYESNEGNQFLAKKKLLEVSSPAELLTTYQRVTSNGARFMLQEAVEGEDSDIYAYTAFWNARHQEVAWVTIRKLRQYPVRYGNGAFLTTVEAPEVAVLSRQLLKSLKYSGYVGTEFKLDPRDNTYYLIEINPRAESFHQLACEAGVDLTRVGYQYLTQREVEADPPRFQIGVKFVNEEGDLHAFAALRKLGKLSLFGWLRSLQGAKTAIAAWDDPRPLLVGLWRFMKIIGQTVASKAAGLMLPT